MSTDAPVQTQAGFEAQPSMPVCRLHNFVYGLRLFYYQWERPVKSMCFTLAFYDGTPPATMLSVIIAADKVAFDYFDRTASISRLMATSLPIIETLSSVLLNCKPNSRRLNG